MENSQIQLYYKYHFLDAKDLSKILRCLNQIFKELQKEVIPTFYNENDGQIYRTFLELKSVNTGNSISVKIQINWKSKLKIIDVCLPSLYEVRVSIAIMLFQKAFLIFGLQSPTLADSDLQDIRNKITEIDKKLELKFSSEKFGLANNIKTTNIKNISNSKIESIVNNGTIEYLEINGIKIK